MDFLSLITWRQYFLASVVGLLLIWFLKTKKRNLPPGPYCLPLIGNLHLVGDELHTSLLDMSKKYGDIFRLYFGNQLFVVVSGKKLFTKMFLTQSAHFSKRPKDFLVGDYLSKGKNFIFSHDMSVEEHKHQKAIAMSAIKKSEKLFSMSKRGGDLHENEVGKLTCLEAIFSEEAILLARELVQLGEDYNQRYEASSKGKADYTEAVAKASALASIRSLCPVILGKRLLPEEAQHIVDMMRDLQTGYNTVGLFAMFPVLKKVWTTPIDLYKSNNVSFEKLMEDYIANALKKAQNSKQEDSDNNKFSAYNSVLDNILQMKEEEQSKNWDDLATLSLVQGVFGAGFDTFSVLSRWMFIYIGIFPEQAEKARNEVDEFIEKNQHFPRYSDRYDLPYVMAYLTEIIRHSSFMPFSVPHSPVEDTVVNNYLVPKEANILFNFMSLNWDPEVFGDHQVFRPERFIADDKSFVKSLADKVNVHGAGRRVCAGLNMSKIQDFMSIVSLLHEFECKPFSKSETGLPRSTMIISITPKTINVKVFKREKKN